MGRKIQINSSILTNFSSLIYIYLLLIKTTLVFIDILDDGFQCPDGEVQGPSGRNLPHPTFPHPEDCQKFYICRNGVQPQKGSCSYGTVYNEETFTCDKPANVPGW